MFQPHKICSQCLVLVFLSLLLTVSVSDLKAEADLTNNSRETVVVAQFGKEKFLLYLPFYIAMEEGLFAKRGIDIDLRFVGNDDQIFASVMSGEALFGIGDPVFAAISREKGGPGKIVAMMIIKLGLSGYTNKSSLTVVQKPDDVKGLRISSFPAPSTTFTLLSEFVKLNKLAPTGTKIVQAAVGGHLAALEADQVDIAVDLEPAVSVAEDKGYRVVFSLDRFTDEQAITGISTLETTISKRPDLVQKIVSGLQEALHLLHTKPEVSQRVSLKLFPNLSGVVIENAVNRMRSLGVYPKSVVVDDSYWQRTLQTRLDSGDLKRPQATSVTVENKFAHEAQNELGAK